jgi:hypothetical protein
MTSELYRWSSTLQKRSRIDALTVSSRMSATSTQARAEFARWTSWRGWSVLYHLTLAVSMGAHFLRVD